MRSPGSVSSSLRSASSTAHQKAAGTTVLTDLLVLRRHTAPTVPCESAAGGGVAAWERAVPLPVDAAGPGPVEDDGGRRRQAPAVNEAFLAHPEWVVGTPSVRQGQYGPEVTVVFDGASCSSGRGAGPGGPSGPPCTPAGCRPVRWPTAPW